MFDMSLQLIDHYIENMQFFPLSTLLNFITAIFFYPGMSVGTDQGAMTTLYVATHPEAPKHSGSYFDACHPKTPSSKAT